MNEPIKYTAELREHSVYIPELFQGTTIQLAHPEGGRVIVNRLNAAFRHCERFYEGKALEQGDSLEKIMASIREHNEQHAGHGPNCSCHDEFARRLKVLVSSNAKTQRDMRSFALLCYHFLNSNCGPAMVDEKTASPPGEGA